MPRPPFLFVLLVLAALAHTPSASAEEPTPLRLYTEVGAQVQPGGVGPLGQLTLRWRFADHWHLDAVGKSGAALGSLTSQDQLFLGFALGPGWSTGEELEGWELRVSPRFTHIHHASFASWGDTPWSNLAGDSDGGVSHRSGVELALGMSGPELMQLGDLSLLWSMDLLANSLPSSPALRVGAGLVFGLSLSGW